MRSFEEVASPGWCEAVTQSALGVIDAETEIVSMSPKGKKLKTPKSVLSPRAKVLKRNLGNPRRLAELQGLPGLSLRFSNPEEMREYATLDPWITLMLNGIRLGGPEVDS